MVPEKTEALLARLGDPFSTRRLFLRNTKSCGRRISNTRECS